MITMNATGIAQACTPHLNSSPHLLSILTSSNIVPLVICTLALSLCLLYFRATQPITLSDDFLQIPSPGSRIPFLGHLPRFLLSPDAWLKSLRNMHSLFALDMTGTKVHVVHAPSLVSKVFSQRADTVSSELFLWWSRIQVFGMPKNTRSTPNAAIIDKLTEELNMDMMRGPGLSMAVKTYVAGMEREGGRLVEFDEDLATMPLWQKRAGANLTTASDGEKAVEVDLYNLIKDFVGVNALATAVGSDFIKNYPNFMSDMWAFDDQFFSLIVGIPSWMQYVVPPLRRALKARERMGKAVARMSKALDDFDNGIIDPDWPNVADVSLLFKRHNSVYRENGWPVGLRGTSSFTLVWALMANANVLIFWLILRISAIPGLTNAILKETSPYVVKDADGKVTIDDEGLSKHCPLLKSCFIECLRLDNNPTAIRKVNKDFSMTPNPAVDTNTPASSTSTSTHHSYNISAGCFIAIVAELHHTNPTHFPSPSEFVPDRHITDGAASYGTMRPWGGGVSICKGRLFAEKEVLSTVAALLPLWRFEPAEGAGGSWRVPGHKRMTVGVKRPTEVVRVRVARR